MITIYVLKNNETDMFYVGQTKNDLSTRFRNGTNYRTCSKLNEAIKMYGRESFEVVETKITEDSEEADFIEKDLIEKYNSVEFGYNTNYGGKSSYIMGNEPRKKLSIANKGKHNSLATEFKKGHKNLKRKVGNLTRSLISISHKGKHFSPKTEFTSENTSLGNNPRARAVKQYDKNYNFIREYSCCSEASLITGIPASSIRCCRNGTLKQAGGYYWKS